MGAKKREVKVSASQKVLSTIKKDDEKKAAIQKSKHESSSVILLQHIPHGFYEKELEEFFKQFGTVKRVMVARSKKTGKSKGYAFVEFEFDEVAKIAAEAMDNYLMFEKLMKCQVVKNADPKKIFKNRYINETFCPKIKNREQEKKLDEVVLSEEKQNVLFNSRVTKLGRRNAKLAELGIDYVYTPPPKKEKKTTENLVERSPKKEVGVNAKKSPLKTPTPKKVKKEVGVNAKNSPFKTPTPKKVKKEVELNNKGKSPLKSPKKVEGKGKGGPKKSIDKKMTTSPKTPKEEGKPEQQQQQGKREPPAKQKFSPKLLRSSKRQSDIAAVLSTQTEKTLTAKKGPKKSVQEKKMPKSPTPSPKAENKKVPKSSTPSPKVEKKQQVKRQSVKAKSSPKSATPKGEKQQVKQEPAKSKFSPKLLRSSKRH